MVLRTGIKIAEWLGAVAAAAASVAACGFWLLSSGPISLDWLAPYVANAFAAAEPGVRAHVDHTLVTLADGPRLQIVAQGVHLWREDGNAELTLPDVSLSLSAEAALFGMFAPTRIGIDGPRLRLFRAADGSVHLGLGAERPGSGDWAETWLHDLAQPPNRQGLFGYLTTVEVRNAALTVEDEQRGTIWQAEAVNASLFRRSEGIAGDLALTLESAGKTAPFHGDFHFEPVSRRLVMSLSFDQLRLALFAGAFANLQSLAAFDLPTSGQFSLTFDTVARHVSDFWCDVGLGQGRIVDPRLPGGSLAIRQGSMRAVFDPTKERLDLEKFAVALDEPDQPKLSLTGTLDGFDPMIANPLAFRAKLEVRDLTAADFDHVWPESVAIHARAWILQHVLGGNLDLATIKLAGHIDTNRSGDPIALDSADGTLNYRNVAIEYFKPLAPVRNIEGTATFDRTRFDFLPTSGAVRDVKFVGGTVHLTKLDTDNEEASIDLALQGPMAQILEQLDTPPLRYARAIGVDPAGVSGAVEGKLHFQLPMKKNLRFAQIDFSAQAKLEQLRLAHLLFGKDLEAGSLELVLNRGAVTVSGRAELAAVPVTLNWVHSLDADPIRTRYKLAGIFDDSARRRFGLDLMPDIVAGPVGVDVGFAIEHSGDAEATVVLDLGGASIDLGKLGWSKHPGQPATANFVLDTRGGRPVSVRGLTIEGSGLDARLDLALADIGGDSTITRADIRKFSAGQTDVSGTVIRRAEGGWHVDMHGRTFDAAPLLNDLQRAPPGGKPEPPLSVSADLNRLSLGPDRVVQSVHAHLFSDGVHWQTANITAIPAPGAKLSLQFGNTPGPGPRKLELATDNFGALLHLLNISSKVHGGQLTVNGQAEDDGPRRMLRGTFDGTNYELEDAPALARLLSLASFTGMGSLVSGQGIPFTRLKGDFVLDGGKIELRNARAYGESIGVNASGNIDYAHDTLDLSGTLVPAYLVNSILGNIPVLGDILLGGKGQGIFAANFHVAGPMTDPSISVNPLSALAPGFLRGLFLFDAARPNPPPDGAARGDTAASGG